MTDLRSGLDPFEETHEHSVPVTFEVRQPTFDGLLRRPEHSRRQRTTEYASFAMGLRLVQNSSGGSHSGTELVVVVISEILQKLVLTVFQACLIANTMWQLAWRSRIVNTGHWVRIVNTALVSIKRVTAHWPETWQPYSAA